MKVDTKCEDQEYWEKILAKHDLSTSKEEPQVVEITSEEFTEIINVELLPEEDYIREDDPVVYSNRITKDTDTLNIDHSGLYNTFEEMLTKVDSDETFFRGHRIVKSRRGDAGDKTGAPRVCPDWAHDNVKIQGFLLRSFPKLAINAKQRKAAGRWARIIQMYFKSQMTHGQIASELGVNLNTILMLIRSIKLAARGFRADTGKARGRRGRLRKS